MNGICFKETLFNAVINGSKTQTRRLMKDKTPIGNWEETYKFSRYKVGEILYLKEPYSLDTIAFDGKVTYKFDNPNERTVSNGFKWENKLFMPAKYARYFIEITAVRCERLQEISDEDIVKEGTLDWVKWWAEKNAPDYEYQHWINDNINGHDQSESYCNKCGNKEIKRRRKLALKKGYKQTEIEDEIFLDGGWSQEEDRIPHCEICEKNLEYSYIGTDNFMDEEVKYLEFDKSGAYFIEHSDIEEIFNYAGFRRKAYAKLINSINGKGTWESNAFVWCYDFKLIKK
ncbi:MAG: hypothetical protein LBE36_13455 [Flavobacteriaceae bacterium]|jgi:hypothetical protein|nr:hypothetical protein [Flavobacteriaceae bacterium]